MPMNRYVVKSLELHLFFGRIMKEHALFLKAGFTPENPECVSKAAFYQEEFESLLCQAVELSDGIVSREVLCSGEVITEFTALAEDQTQCLTGIPINREITEQERGLHSGPCSRCDWQMLGRKVRQLNRTALKQLDGLISFKETILKCVLNCEMFTVNYPLLIEHILREAKLYRQYVSALERNGDLPLGSMWEIECFWNQIMMEHAQFIRGLLDPCEAELFRASDDFANQYRALLEVSRSTHNMTLTAQSLEKTVKFRDFKAAGAQGIQQCKIRSIILPLLADHVLREANHYIRLLRS